MALTYRNANHAIYPSLHDSSALQAGCLHPRAHSQGPQGLGGWTRQFWRKMNSQISTSSFASKSIPSIPFPIDISTPLFYISHVQALYCPSLVMPMTLMPLPTSIVAGTLQVPHHHL